MMVMVIGLRSGKEFLVKDKSYSFESDVTGELTRVFESVDNKRVITVPPESSSIEYFDEESSAKVLTALEGGTEVKEDEGASDLYG